MRAFRLLFVIAFFSSTYGSDLRVEPVEENIVLSSQNDLLRSVTLYCRLYNAPSITQLHGQWVIQNEDTTLTINQGVSRNQYTAPLTFEDLMLLTIEGLSYKHNGAYTCRARDVSDVLSNFELATITLSLELELETSPKGLVVSNTTERIELRCEMSGYIEPDRNLQWFKNEQKITDGSDKYEIHLEEGNKPSVFGGEETQSRVSVLVVLDFQQESDTGGYKCKTLGSEKSASVFVGTDEVATVNPTPSSPATSIPITPVSTDPSSPGEKVNPTQSSPATRNPITPVSSNPSSPGENGDDTEASTVEEGEMAQEDVSVFIIAITASCVGLVLIFSTVLLIMLCCLCCKRYKQKEAAKNNSTDAITTITLWNGFQPPPLPSGPRPNLNRMSQTSDYYVNDGEDPENPYRRIPPYTSMASFSVQAHLQLPTKSNTSGDRYSYLGDSSSSHMYDTISEDDKVTSQEAKLHKTSSNEEGSNDVVSVSNRNELECTAFHGNGEIQNHNNVAESEDSTSNDEYVHIPDGTSNPSSHHEDDSMPTEGGQDVVANPEDDPKFTNSTSEFSTYDKLASH